MRAAYWDDVSGQGRLAAGQLLLDVDATPVADLGQLLDGSWDAVVVPLEDDVRGIRREVVDHLIADEHLWVRAAAQFVGTYEERWILVGARPDEPVPAEATLLLAVPRADRPGALAEILVAFSSRGQNVARVEPRPRGGLGAFGFVLEVEGSGRDPGVADALREVRAAVQELRILGELAQASTPAGALAPARVTSHRALAPRVGIVGLGLIGGSLAYDLLGVGRAVVGHDPHAVPGSDRSVWDRIDHARTLEDLARSVDIAVVAAPLAVTEDVVRALLAAAPDLVVTDAGSIKAPFAAAFAGRPRVIGGHPMAGTERSGFAAARPGLFDSAPWLFTPDDTADPDAVAEVVDLALAVGARAWVLDAEAHDRAVATISHAPHLLAFALQSLASTDALDLARLAGPSFRDMTRVAASDPDFWTDLLGRNRDAVTTVVRDVTRWLDGVATASDDDLHRCLVAARRTPAGPIDPPVWLPLAGDDLVARLRDLTAAGRPITSLREGDGGFQVLA